MLNSSACPSGAGRILATLILGVVCMSVSALASAQNNAPPGTLSLSSSVLQPTNLNGGDQPSRPGGRVIMSTGASQATAAPGGQSASSLAPSALAAPVTIAPSGYGSGGGVVYGSSSGDVGYIGVVPNARVPDHGDVDWAGPVMPGERVRAPRRLSTEERVRLRSDIRDASRNMYEHPRTR
jgi:hypothetical protein